MTEAQHPPVGPIAYLTSQYPRATDTFVQREVRGLRALGREVLTCSIRRTGPEHHTGPEQIEEARNTFCVLEATARPLGFLRTNARIFARSPTGYFKALGLALRTRPPGLRALFYQLVYFFEAVTLAAHLTDKGVRHLHNHIAEASCTVAMLASALGGFTYSFTLHGPGIFFAPERWRLDEKIARASFVACISHFCRSQGMIFAGQAHWAKMHILHCGVDPDLYDRPRPEPGKQLLFVGRLAGVKGVPVLFEALVALREAHPEIRLELVGDGPERPALEARARELGISDLVHFAGYLSQAEVAERLAAADIFVLPSFAEGLPVVLMEALAARLPVVTTRIAGTGELVEDGESGYLVAPGDAAALADRLGRLLDAPGTRQAMGERGRQMVAAEFSSQVECARLAHLFDLYAAGDLPKTIRAPLPSVSVGEAE